MKDDETKQSTPTNERRRDEKQSTDKATKRNLASRPGETTRRQFTGRRNERNILSTIYLHIFLNSAWDNKERVIRPRTNNRQTQKNDDDDDKNKTKNRAHFKTVPRGPSKFPLPSHSYRIPCRRLGNWTPKDWTQQGSLVKIGCCARQGTKLIKMQNGKM